MKTSHQLPDGFCFPTPPGRIDHDLRQTPIRSPVAVNYLTEIQRWRDTVATAIDPRDPAIAGLPHFTPRARARLAMLLSTEWDVQTRLWAVGHGLAPFPADLLYRGHPMETLLEALYWRAAVVLYLTGAWDALDKPELKMQECAAIGMFMRPVRLEGLCVYCLTEYGPNHLAPEDHDCIMALHIQPAA